MNSSYSSNHPVLRSVVTDLGYLVISVQVVHPEGEVELLHPRVQLVLLCVLLDRPEVGQHPHKVLEKTTTIFYYCKTDGKIKENCT